MEAKDKRVKREIANSNERRRMQSINAGFQKLKRLLPVNEGEKMSKAAILQHASDFVQRIEREKLLLHEQNTQLRSILLDIKNGTEISVALKTTDLDALPVVQVNPYITTIDTDIDTMNNNSNDNADVISDRGTEISVALKTTDLDASPIVQDNPDITKIETDIDTINNNSNDNADIISDRVTSPKNNKVSSGIAKAAIALPLEVPYISDTAIRLDPHHHDMQLDVNPAHARKMIKTKSVNPLDPQESAPKGQNLDTICKAIMEIEGDRVFNNKSL